MIRIIESKDGADFLAGLRLRDEQAPDKVKSAVADIISDVRLHGDEALRKYAATFDGVELGELEVCREEIEKAYNSCDPALINVISTSRDNIERYHAKQKREGYSLSVGNGSLLGQRIMPLKRVGIYVPAGTAAYPSSVLMNAVPAKVAGVGEIIMITPPKKDGHADKTILAAAWIAGVDRVFLSGGAGAVAALGYGTETVPKVDKITGPGNMYVAEAKRQVFGAVDIDMIAGPSEILIIADEEANVRYIAADMLSQAEHDVKASAVLLTTSCSLAKSVATELELQLCALNRKDIARKSIDDYSAIILCKTKDEAFKISDTLAPEHLEILTKDPRKDLEFISNAGSVFLGEYSPEPLGDYFAGTNHILPTGGTARFSSPLNVDDFMKKQSFIHYTRESLKLVHEQIEYFAHTEGLTAHENSIAIRFGKDE